MVEFFTPVSKKVLANLEVLQDGVLGRQMEIHSERAGFPEMGKCKFALFGIKEARGSVDYKGNLPDFDPIRMAFYSLFAGNWQYAIADLGDIEAGETLADTHFAIKEAVTFLLKKKIIPVVLGSSQDLVYPIYRAYDDFGKMINFVNIDSRFDIGNAEGALTNISYVGKMVVDKPYNLFNYSTLGYQTYFNPSEEIVLIDKLYFDAFRLGEIINNIGMVEPVLRDADIVSMDVSAIKSAELSYINAGAPNGFDSREICAIARYAGISNRVTAFGLYEIMEMEKSRTAAMLFAQIMWYFIEGVNCRIDDGKPSSQIDFEIYKVPVEDEILVFKKSLKTGRWWIELPFVSEANNKLKRHTLLPCTYQDYENACNQEIPERWYKARRKNEI